jgi:hypothetical protein
MIQTWVKDKEPVAKASQPSTSAQVSVVTAVKASGSALQEEEKTPLIDRLMRFLHGELKLANGPPTQTQAGHNISDFRKKVENSCELA